MEKGTKNQSRVGSFIEANLNVFSGFLISLIMWTFIVSPLWGFDTRVWDNLGITALFTISSIIRSYFWRRWFERRIGRE